MPVLASVRKPLSKALIAWLGLGLALPAFAQSVDMAVASADTGQVADTVAAPAVLVVGQRPGPGLWKVTKGEHVMWVFGTYSPLPKKMEWRSHEVETKLAQSQEFIGPPGLKVGVGFFKGLVMLPQLIGVKKNPGGARLRDVLPADVYARWLPLKAKYIGKDDDIESYRPLFAADELMRKGLDQAGLSKGHEVRGQLEWLARRDKLKMTMPKLRMELDAPSRVLKTFKKSSLDDVACFAKTVEWLEGDIDAMRRRANAWAMGDIDALRQLDFAEREDACRGALANSALAQSEPQFKALEARTYDAWLAAAEKALSANASTFAVLELKDILDPHGPLAVLQSRGYAIESPE